VARLLLGVCGGVAAYKSVEFVRLALDAGHAVRVVQTENSEKFVGRATFESISGAPVLVDTFEQDPSRGVFPGDPTPEHAPITHLALAANCDIMIVAPATANTLAQMAGGHAGNLLTTLFLACTKPVVVAPAMNNHMYEHPAVRQNLGILSDWGALVIDPGVGALASHGEAGVGRLAEPPEILEIVEQTLQDSSPTIG